MVRELWRDLHWAYVGHARWEKHVQASWWGRRDRPTMAQLMHCIYHGGKGDLVEVEGSGIYGPVGDAEDVLEVFWSEVPASEIGEMVAACTAIGHAVMFSRSKSGESLGVSIFTHDAKPKWWPPNAAAARILMAHVTSQAVAARAEGKS